MDLGQGELVKTSCKLDLVVLLCTFHRSRCFGDLFEVEVEDERWKIETETGSTLAADRRMPTPTPTPHVHRHMKALPKLSRIVPLSPLLLCLVLRLRPTRQPTFQQPQTDVFLLLCEEVDEIMKIKS